MLQQQLVGDGRELPPRGHIAGRSFARRVLNQLNAPEQHIFFLLRRHGNRIFVGIAVRADFMPGLDDQPGLFGKGLD